MPVSSTSISSMLGYGVPEGLGTWFVSSWVKVAWYWRFKMLALSFGALKRRHLSFSGVIPVLSFLTDLM